MADDAPVRDSFQEWRLGIALLFGVVLVAAIGIEAFRSFGAPYPGLLGLATAALAFLAGSYLVYGR